MLQLLTEAIKKFRAVSEAAIDLTATKCASFWFIFVAPIHFFDKTLIEKSNLLLNAQFHLLHLWSKTELPLIK